jgi:ribosome-associated protein YbcJ (S4-like RNA binding protein)
MLFEEMRVIGQVLRDEGGIQWGGHGYFFIGEGGVALAF